MRKHGGTPSWRDKQVTLAAISPPSVARGRFAGGHQSGLAGCKPPPLFMRGASSCPSQGQRQGEPWGASPRLSAPTYLSYRQRGREVALGALDVYPGQTAQRLSMPQPKLFLSTLAIWVSRPCEALKRDKLTSQSYLLILIAPKQSAHASIGCIGGGKPPPQASTGVRGLAAYLFNHLSTASELQQYSQSLLNKKKPSQTTPSGEGSPSDYCGTAKKNRIYLPTPTRAFYPYPKTQTKNEYPYTSFD